MTGDDRPATPGPTKELSHLDDRTLVLMRHAQAGQPGGVRDHDRPLTDTGRAAAGRAGDWLRSHLDPVEDILSSTAVRAQQTALATGLPAAIRLDAGLYDAAPADILTLLHATEPSVRTLLVVGHAPGIPAAAAQLLPADGDPEAADELRQRFSAGAFAVLRCSGEWAELAPGTARLAHFLVPAVER